MMLNVIQKEKIKKIYWLMAMGEKAQLSSFIVVDHQWKHSLTLELK